MADEFIQLNVGVGGEKVDVEELVVGPNTVTRSRIQLTGATAAEVARIENVAPAAGDYGMVTRNIPSGVQPISAAALPLPAGAATEPTILSILGQLDVALSTRAAEHVTAASSHSARLTDGAAFYDATKTGQLPGALVGGRLDENVGAWLGSTAPTVGQKSAVDSIPVVLPSAPTTAALSSASINASAIGDNTLIAGVGGQTIRVFRLFIVFAQAVDFKFKNGAATDFTAAMSMSKNGSMTLDIDFEPWFVTSAANAFILDLSAAVQASGRIYYTQS